MADASFATDSDASVEQSRQQNVFYNPVQQFNRDLSVLAIKAFGRDLCEKRRARHEKTSIKAQNKQERKRKRREVRQEVDDRQDGSGKLVKLEDGTGFPTEGQTVDGAHAPMDKTTSHSTGNGDTLCAESEGKLGENGDLGPNDRDEPQSGSGSADGIQNTSSWIPRYRILDALSATGLRALRYATEIPFATTIVANDMDRGATKSIKTNVEHNQLTSKITVTTGNAIGHMYRAAYPPDDSHGPHHISGKYDVIDLDPYGTAAPFIDSALQALNDGGLLCVTCTDSGVFASCGYSEKTYSLYGGMPIKGPHSHEGGLRLILNSIASSAARYGMAIEPLLSLSIDFYIRIFVRVTKSPADVKFLSGKTMIVYDCDAGCGAWYTQMLGRNIRQTGKVSKELEKNPTFNFKHSIAQAPSAERLCTHCNSKMHIAGPMWAGPLHNAAFVERLLADARAADKEIYQTKQRIEGMLDTALDELIVIPEADVLWRIAKDGNNMNDAIPKTRPETVDPHPFFFIPSALSKVIHCVAPPEAAIKGAIRHLGYRATRSHCKPGSIKTDAPWTVIWEIMREWVRQRQPIKEGALKEGLAGWNIMQKVRKLQEGKDGHATINGKPGPGISNEIPTDEKTQSGARPLEEPSLLKIVFDEALGKDKPSGKKLVRYQQNPRENWGPMSRAKGSG